MNNWQFYGLFLDKESRDKLISFLQNSKWGYLFEETSKVYLDHCTLLHKNNYNDLLIHRIIKNKLDELISNNTIKVTLVIKHIGISEKALAFGVKFKDNDANISSFHLLCLNEHPHITIGTFSNGKPVESNYIKKWVGIKPIEVKTILKRI